MRRPSQYNKQTNLLYYLSIYESTGDNYFLENIEVIVCNPSFL